MVLFKTVLIVSTFAIAFIMGSVDCVGRNSQQSNFNLKHNRDDKKKLSSENIRTTPSSPVINPTPRRHTSLAVSNIRAYPASNVAKPQVQHPKGDSNPLLKKATDGSIVVLFLLLTWRTLATYEMSESFSSTVMRILTAIPIMLLLCSNVAGIAVNIMKPTNFKAYMKGILALNILRECIEIVYNIYMLMFSTSFRRIPKEVYFGRFFSNIWWLSLCVSFIKSRWVLSPILKSIPKDSSSDSNMGNWPGASRESSEYGQRY